MLITLKGHCSVSKVSNIRMYSIVACLFVNVLIECFIYTGGNVLCLIMDI